MGVKLRDLSTSHIQDQCLQFATYTACDPLIPELFHSKSIDSKSTFFALIHTIQIGQLLSEHALR